MQDLTTKQAFDAMTTFLEDYYQRTQAKDVGKLLGGLQVLCDGKPADPSLWDNWVKAIQKTVPKK